MLNLRKNWEIEITINANQYSLFSEYLDKAFKGRQHSGGRKGRIQTS